MQDYYTADRHGHRPNPYTPAAEARRGRHLALLLAALLLAAKVLPLL